TAELAGGDEVRAGQMVLQLSIIPAAAEAPPAKPAPFAKPTPAAKPAEGLPAAPAVPGYEIDTEIGRGGRGIVYRATRQADGELVAIKIVRPAPGVPAGDVERFLQAARLLTEVQEGNVVRLLDVGSAGLMVYLV